VDAPAVDAATLAALFEDIGRDEDAMRELIGAFLRQSGPLVSQMREPAKLHGGAHTLKSTAALLGASRLAALCRALEAESGAGPVVEAPARVAEVERELARVTAELERWTPGYRK
jgi:HPt (histidine-containing phosphotransfer) domain-containing protein